MRIKVSTTIKTPMLVHPREMVDGALAIVVVAGVSCPAGALIARHCGRLTIIGSDDYGVDGWPCVTYPCPDIRVRVLKQGESVTLEVA